MQVELFDVLAKLENDITLKSVIMARKQNKYFAFLPYYILIVV